MPTLDANELKRILKDKQDRAPKYTLDPNPHISILDDPQTKKQIAKQGQHALEMVDELRTAPPPSKEQWEREQFQAASNALAEENPLYAAARGANNFLVLPLEPGGTRPLVDPSEATRDDRQIFEWWHEQPNANPGVAVTIQYPVLALWTS